MQLDTYLRAERGRLTALAARLGMPISTLQGYATKRRRPSVDCAVRIERATLGLVTAAELAIDEGKSNGTQEAQRRD
jgi:DNA-binding transcriptional regulator YdaS (Cro superfamily)